MNNKNEMSKNMEQLNTETVKVPLRLTLSVVAACLIAFCGLLTETAVNVAFPVIMKEFHVGTATVQWLTTGNLLVVAMVTPLSAFLQKRFHIRHLFFFAAIVFAIGTVCGAFAPNFAMLMFARIIQGAATGVGVPLSFCIILEQIPYQKLGTYTGFGSLVSAAAPACGPTYGGICTSAVSWRLIFIILIPVLIFTIILGAVTIRETKEPKKIALDKPSALLIVLAFFCLVFGFANLSSVLQRPVQVLLFIAIGVVFLVLFFFRCKKSSNPVLQVKIFKYPAYNMHLLAFFFMNCITLGMSFCLPNYSQVALLLSSMTAGLMMLPGAGLNAACGPISGALLDRIGPAVPVLFGACLMTVATGLLLGFGTTMTPVMMVVFYIIFGIGCGSTFGNTMTTAMMRLPVELKTDGNTALNTAMQFGGAVGTSVASAFVAFAQMSNITGISYEMKTRIGTTHSFLFMFILCLICLVCQITGLRIAQKAKED